MSGINIKKTQDCYKNFLYNMVPILHILHRFIKPSVWLIIALSTAVSIQFASSYWKQYSQSYKFFWRQNLL